MYDLTQGLRIDPACFRVLKAKAHMERVLLVRRCKGIDAHRDHPHDYEVDPMDPLGSSSLNKMKNPGTWPYNRPCAQQYVGKYQSCMVISGRLIVHAPVQI